MFNPFLTSFIMITIMIIWTKHAQQSEKNMWDLMKYNFLLKKIVAYTLKQGSRVEDMDGTACRVLPYS